MSCLNTSVILIISDCVKPFLELHELLATYGYFSSHQYCVELVSCKKVGLRGALEDKLSFCFYCSAASLPVEICEKSVIF